jgi:hypothetical protein
MSYADKGAGFSTDANMNHVKVDSRRVFIMPKEYQ